MLSTPFCGATESPSTQFSESCKDTCRMSMPNDLNLSIYRRRSVSGDYSAYKLDPQHRCH